MARLPISPRRTIDSHSLCRLNGLQFVTTLDGRFRYNRPQYFHQN